MLNLVQILYKMSTYHYATEKVGKKKFSYQLSQVSLNRLQASHRLTHQIPIIPSNKNKK
jgi:hypothetical protein